MKIQEIWLVYSREHNAFWRPNAAGYTVHIDGAGRYTKEAAEKHCGSRDFADADNPPEIAVLAPEAADHIDRLEADKAELATELDRLQEAEESYRTFYSQFKGSDIRTGRAWDLLRRSGDRARALIARHKRES